MADWFFLKLVVRMQNNNNYCLLVMWMLNGIVTFKGTSSISYKANGSLSTWSSNYDFLPRYLLIWLENLWPHKYLRVNVYSSFIHNCQTLETTKMVFSRWMTTQIVVHSYNGILFSNKMEWTINHTSTWMILKYILLYEIA